jgi:periplasmic protein TonB
MMSEQEQEKKNQRIAFLSTLGIQVVVFLLLFVMVAYSPPNPPLPQVGVELNIGFDDQGGGDNPATTPVGDEGNQPEEAKVEPKEVKQEEVKEEVVTETKPVDTKPTEDVVSTKAESPVSVKEKKEEKPVEKPKVKVEEKKTEVKPTNTYTPPTDSKATGTKEGKPGSEGTDEGKTGNKGKPDGTLVKGGQYEGTPGGGGGGSSLELDGWKWEQKPNPNVPNNESGRIVFNIEVDANGEIFKITKIESTLSLEAEKICREAIEKLSLVPDGDNVAAISKGKITFVVVSK